MKGNGTLTKVIGGLVTALIMAMLGIAISGVGKNSNKVQANEVSIGGIKVENKGFAAGIARLERKQEKLADKIDILPEKVAKLLGRL